MSPRWPSGPSSIRSFGVRCIEVGGPENLTFNELAALLQDVRGSDAKVRHVPRGVLRVLASFGSRQAARRARDGHRRHDVRRRRRAAAAYADLPVTDLRTALTRTLDESQRL